MEYVFSKAAQAALLKMYSITSVLICVLSVPLLRNLYHRSFVQEEFFRKKKTGRFKAVFDFRKSVRRQP